MPKSNGRIDKTQFTELMYQALETEIGGQVIYKAAIKCAQNASSRKSGRSTSRRRRTTSGSSGRRSGGSVSRPKSIRRAARSFGTKPMAWSRRCRWR